MSAISKADVLETFADLYDVFEDNKSIRKELDKVYDRLNALPSVTPEQRWIPCSETVDIPDHEIMACDKYGEMMFGYLVYEDDQWLCESDDSVMYDPKAWCEKPEPYRGEGEK